MKEISKGDRVRCINDNYSGYQNLPDSRPMAGNIYVVKKARYYEEMRHGMLIKGMYIQVEGIDGDKYWHAAMFEIVKDFADHILDNIAKEIEDENFK